MAALYACFVPFLSWC